LINRIKSLTNTEDKKRLISNFFSLSVLQIVSYILPFITLPYLVRVLGIEYYGILAFAGAVIAYLGIITNYGFNLTATRDISAHRDNKQKIIEIFSAVMIIKFILMLGSFLVLILLVFSFDKLSKDWLIYFLTFGSVAGQVLFPIWFFQGMERMKYITYINIGSKLIFTVAIFVFVHSKEDLYMVPLLNSLGILAGGIYSLILVKKNFGVKFEFQNIGLLKQYMIDGWHIFVSSFGVHLYKGNAILILGVFTTDLTVGYFAIAKKIIDALNQVASIISRTLFPYVVKNHQINKKFIQFLSKLGAGILFYTFLFFIFLIFFTEHISLLISGEVHKELVISLYIMAIVPLAIAINIPAVHILLIGKKDRYYSRSVLSGGVVDLFLLFALIPHYGYIGAAVSVLLTEIFVTLMLYFYAVKLVKGRI